MYEVLAGMKDVAQRNFAHAKAVLSQNPQLSRTLFLMEIILGIVDAPELSDVSTDYDRVDMAGEDFVVYFERLMSNRTRELWIFRQSPSFDPCSDWV